MKRTVMMLAALLALAGVGEAVAQGYVVVVNAANPTSSISKSEAADLFLKKKAKWSDGKTVAAVDQSKSAPVRDAFSKAVHGKPAAAVASYWQQQIFSGKEVPPAEKGSDDEVIAFVKSNPGAIGYVSAGASLGGVKKVAIN